MNTADVAAETYVFKLMNSSGVSESGESEKVLLLMESGVRLHSTIYMRDKSNTPSGFTLKLRKHIRTLEKKEKKKKRKYQKKRGTHGQSLCTRHYHYCDSFATLVPNNQPLNTVSVYLTEMTTLTQIFSMFGFN
ncbi:hypothetical protein LR48_Vigan01g173900 [Vigna angularis]|uniref:Uncharacterized protein n=1 Tax=Phaseolus angularis TaxID=3914 RepID=A0A0L9TNM3_PHAAN|nr:hypothetical protein LR48_Vigan01g173900 [Vigna angularis]